MDKKVTYPEQTDVENTLRLRDVLKTFSFSFFWNNIQPSGTGL